MSDDLKERLDVLIRTEQTGSRLLMQLGIDVLARIKDLERPCASRPCIRDGRGHVTGEVAVVARAIAENGFTRPWDDFLPVNVFDADQSDLIEYAKAAVAAMRLIAMSKPRGEPAREGGK